MRIAIFTETYFPFISGVVTHIETLKNGLEAQGHKVMIVTLNPKAEKHYIEDDVLYCPAIPLKKIYGYGVANPLNMQRLKIIKNFNPDLIHIHTEFSMGIFGQFAAKRLHIPLVYTLHTMYDDYLGYIAPGKLEKLMKPAAHVFFRKVAKKATEIIGPSNKVVEFLRRCGVERHINIIPNIVDLSQFKVENVSPADTDAVRAKLGITPQDTAVCFVGRLGGEKSIDVLIDFFAKSAASNEHLKLFIIGDGPEHDNLQKQIDGLNMQNQIRLLGRIEHDALPPYYQACNLFSTASLSEMNSISMLEAMASGLYVLQRFDVYNKDQICEGVNGHTFTEQAGFDTLLQEQISLSDSEKLQRRCGVTEYTNRYGIDQFLDSVMNVYQRAQMEYAAKNKK